ncbi:hypothetical protein H9L12_11445 [Sphingomonas rhizophila]|uniref:Uncharacterized protein n=1 Tax=Sphingomonas rhizophila TaxID=2071607 RepID=A0A7G9SAG4_9SPHN|nr:hypothetical protein [Sphingomonas rhizophila]QNN64839.1 hypothetical protein H9L12_11445 [Sphingomonas rhizophila]
MTVQTHPRPSGINWRLVGWGGAAALLALPFVAMQFTTEVNWTASDFVVMGLLIGTIGLGLEFLLRKASNTTYRLAAAITLGTAFLTIWVNLAVGMIGSEDNPYNLLFVGVLFVALIGAILTRFSSSGMARTTVVAAAIQLAVGAFGYAVDPRGAVFSMLFALPWLLAAALYRSAGDIGK